MIKHYVANIPDPTARSRNEDDFILEFFRHFVLFVGAAQEDEDVSKNAVATVRCWVVKYAVMQL